MLKRNTGQKTTGKLYPNATHKNGFILPHVAPFTALHVYFTACRLFKRFTGLFNGFTGVLYPVVVLVLYVAVVLCAYMTAYAPHFAPCTIKADNLPINILMPVVAPYSALYGYMFPRGQNTDRPRPDLQPPDILTGLIEIELFEFCIQSQLLVIREFRGEVVVEFQKSEIFLFGIFFDTPPP